MTGTLEAAGTAGQVGDALVGVNPDGQIVLADHRAEAFFGYSWAELSARPLASLLTGDDTAHTPLSLVTLLGRDVGVHCRRKDGTRFAAESFGAQADGIDGPLVTLTLRRMAADRPPGDTVPGRSSSDPVAEHERGQEVYRLLLEATTLAIVGIDGSGTIVSANPAATRLFDYAVDQMIGQPVENLVPETARGGHVAQRSAYLQHPVTREMGSGLRLHARRRDGTSFPAEISLAALDTGPNMLVAATIHDLTSQENAEREQQRMQVELSRAQRLQSIGQLAAGIAHDFNNTLGVLLVESELLVEELQGQAALDSPDVRARLIQGITRIQGATKRTAKLTQDLLTFGQRQALQPEPIELDQIVTEASDMLSRTIGNSISVIKRTNAPGAQVLADRAKLEQVLFNLTINARDAMPNGGTVTLATAYTRLDTTEAATAGLEPGLYLRLTVTDTGSGIPADIVEHVFEPFYTTKGEGKGSGLGLASVHGTIVQAGGTVQLASVVDQGTTVTVLLPALDVAGGDALATTDLDPASRRSAHLVLVVDDDPDLRRLSATVLQRAGYHVLLAGSGVEAVGLARETPTIDLVLTDVSMPGMSGPQAAKAIQAIRPRMHVVFMSGHARAIFTPDELREGVNLIEKPFTKAVLVDRIDRALSVVS